MSLRETTANVYCYCHDLRGQMLAFLSQTISWCFTASSMTVPPRVGVTCIALMTQHQRWCIVFKIRPFCQTFAREIAPQTSKMIYHRGQNVQAHLAKYSVIGQYKHQLGRVLLDVVQSSFSNLLDCTSSKIKVLIFEDWVRVGSDVHSFRT